MLKKCPDCAGELESGAMIDNLHTGFMPQRYGKLTLSTHKSNGLFMLYEENSDFLNVRRVYAYRCQSCNRIFQYAQDVVVSENLKRDHHTQETKVLFFIFVLIAVMFVAMATALIAS